MTVKSVLCFLRHQYSVALEHQEGKGEILTEVPMEALVEKLDTKLREWKPETADEVRQRVAEIIDLADQDALDVVRSRIIEQEVLDMLDEPISR